MKNKILKIFFIAIIIGSFNNAGAVVLNQTAGGNLAFTIEPKNPGELTDVLIKASSLDTDLEKSQVLWYLDDALVIKGVGVDNFGFQTKKAGNVSKIRAVVVSENSTKVIEKTSTINPADVDILWQSDSHTPPLYRGKALPGAKSTIRIIAMPNFISEKGIKLDPKSLKYEWKKNNNILERGIGKNNISTQIGNSLLETEIKLITTSPDGSISAEKTIKIKPENPTILFYEEKPIEGLIYTKELGSNPVFNQNETTIKAEPYFFSISNSLFKNLSFLWKINNESASPSESDITKIVLRNETGKETSSKIDLVIRNTNNIYQETARSLNITSKSLIKF